MRYFLTVLFAAITFFAAGQPAKPEEPMVVPTVTIPITAARYFLERDDVAKVLERKDSISRELIVNLQDQVGTQVKIINTYKQDSITSISYTATKNEEISLLNQELKLAKKDANKQRFLKIVAFVGMGVVILVTFIKQ